MCLVKIIGEVTQRYKTNITPYKKIFSGNYLMIKNISTDFMNLRANASMLPAGRRHAGL